MYELFELEDCILDNDMKLMYISNFTNQKDWKDSRHSHNFLEIFFCISGSCSFYIRDTQLILNKNDFIIINPYVEHSEKVKSSTISEMVLIAIKNASIELINNSLGYFHGNFNGISEIITNNLIQLMYEVKEKKQNYKNVCINIINILLIHIKRVSNKVLNKFDSKYIISQNHSISWIKQYIDDNYTLKLKLDDLALKIGLNKYGLVREFKKIYNISPIEYMLNLRFKEAKFLLSTTNHSINYISQTLGFNCSNYFSQCFQKREGISPSEYRNIQYNKEKDIKI